MAITSYQDGVISNIITLSIWLRVPLEYASTPLGWNAVVMSWWNLVCSTQNTFNLNEKNLFFMTGFFKVSYPNIVCERKCVKVTHEPRKTSDSAVRLFQLKVFERPLQSWYTQAYKQRIHARLTSQSCFLCMSAWLFAFWGSYSNMAHSPGHFRNYLGFNTIRPRKKVRGRRNLNKK